MSIVQLALITAISAPFALSIWFAYLRRPLVLVSESGAPEAYPLTRPGFVAETLDPEPMVRAVAHALVKEAKANFVQIELAIDPGIKARINPNALGTALRVIALTAIQATPGGQVLITGTILAGQLHIRITDDGKDTDQRTREGLIRSAEELIALQGGSVDVFARQDRATTVTIRVPLPAERSDEFSEEPALMGHAA